MRFCEFVLIKQVNLNWLTRLYLLKVFLSYSLHFLAPDLNHRSSVVKIIAYFNQYRVDCKSQCHKKLSQQNYAIVK